MSDQHPCVPLDLDPDNGRAEEHLLDQGEIASKRELYGRDRLRRLGDDSLTWKIREQRVLKIFERHAQGGGDSG